MSLRAKAVLFVLWMVSLGIVAGVTSAQTRPDPGAVISGADLGFRPDGWRGKARTGRFVVRINGEWVDAVESVAARPATQ
jgi:hypothetical protein